MEKCLNVVVKANPKPPTGAVETLQTPIKTPMKILAVLAEHPHLALPEVAVKIGKSHRAV